MIYPGITIDGVYVGGLNPNEAIKLLRETYIETVAKDAIILIGPEKQYRLPLDDIAYGPDYVNALDTAYMQGREGNFVERLKRVGRLKSEGLHIKPEICYNKEKIGNILDSIIKGIEIKPKDAGITIKKGRIEITPHENGLLADRELTIYKIYKSLQNRTLNDVVLSMESVMPDITTEMVEDIAYKLGEYQTAFNPENESRSHNIRTACEKISQKLLLHGQVFSMDKMLGERTEKNGYRTAKVIVGNELVDGLGGGICQVTSTAYNAVLLSGLEVVERRNHSIPLSYIDMGRDATISYGYIDFRFKNNSGYAVVIEAEASGGRVYVSIWGKRPERICTVKIRTKITDTIEAESVEMKEDETLSPGEAVVEKEAVPGYIVEVYRDTYDTSGNLTKTEKLSVDRYQPQKKIIRVGPKTR
jgi:vancomycin resistance protein YoaR